MAIPLQSPRVIVNFSGNSTGVSNGLTPASLPLVIRTGGARRRSFCAREVAPCSGEPAELEYWVGQSWHTGSSGLASPDEAETHVRLEALFDFDVDAEGAVLIAQADDGNIAVDVVLHLN